MLLRINSVAVSAVVMTLLWATPGNAELVTNGGFELPADGIGNCDTVIDSWMEEGDLNTLRCNYGTGQTPTLAAMGGTGLYVLDLAAGTGAEAKPWTGVSQDLGAMDNGRVYNFSARLGGSILTAVDLTYKISFFNVNDSTELKAITESDFLVTHNAGIDVNMSYTAGAGDDGDTLRLIAVAVPSAPNFVHVFMDEVSVTEAIPEPGTLALLACGLVGLLCYPQRKRRR